MSQNKHFGLFVSKIKLSYHKKRHIPFSENRPTFCGGHKCPAALALAWGLALVSGLAWSLEPVGLAWVSGVALGFGLGLGAWRFSFGLGVGARILRNPGHVWACGACFGPCSWASGPEVHLAEHKFAEERSRVSLLNVHWKALRCDRALQMSSPSPGTVNDACLVQPQNNGVRSQCSEWVLYEHKATFFSFRVLPQCSRREHCTNKIRKCFCTKHKAERGSWG